MGQQGAALGVRKPPISPKHRTKVLNWIGVSRAAARERHAKSSPAEEVIQVPDSTPPAPVKVPAIVLAKSFLQKQQMPRERHPLEFTPPSCSLHRNEAIGAMPDSSAHPQLKEPMLVQPNIQGSKAVKYAEPIVQGTHVEISPSMDEAYAKMEHDPMKCKSSEKQVASSSNAPIETSLDVVSSVTPGSVRQNKDHKVQEKSCSSW